MQYPIIDNLIYAYLKNGWTGLTLTYGKNLFDSYDISFQSGIKNDVGEITPSEVSHYTDNFTIVNPNTIYTLSGTLTFGESFVRLYFYDNNKNWISRTPSYISNIITFTTPVNCYYIQIQVNVNVNLENAQLEEGPEATPYEPYHVPDTDISHRLKLPLQHYFPHPVIDSLKRASEGTMTNKDREILTHYLTPLGIGGI